MNSKPDAGNFDGNAATDDANSNANTDANSGENPAPRARFSPVWWLYLLAAIRLLGPFLPLPNALAALTGGVVLTAIYIGAVVAFSLGIARRRFKILDALGWLGVCVAVWLSMQRGLLPLVGRAFDSISENGGAPTTSQQLLLSLATILQDLALFGGATFAGTLIARLVRHANMIGPIGAAIVLIDIWGVLFGGIVSQILANKTLAPITEKAMTQGPSLGSASHARTGFSIEIPAIGVGDFLFIALLLSVLVNLSMNWRTSARLMWLLVVVALLAMQLLALPPLPGLLFIGAAAVLPNWKFFKFTREESFALLYAGIFVLILTVGLFFGFKAMLPVSK